MVDRNLLAVAATPVAHALGLRDGMLGAVLGAAFAIPYALAAMPLGRMADRGTVRVLLIGGMVTWTAASLAVGLARSSGELVGARILLGLGQAAFVPAALSVLTGGDRAVPGRLSLFTGSSSLGRSLALLGGGAVLAAVAGLGQGWRWLFVLTTAPNLLLIAALLASRISRGQGAGEVEQAGVAAAPALLFLLAACAPIVAGQAAIAWLPTLLIRLQDQTPATAGMLVGAVSLVAGPAGQLLGGILVRRSQTLRERPLITVAAGIWAALPPLLLVAQARTPLAAAIGIAGVNLTLGVAAFAALWGWQALWPRGRRGLGNGAYMATITLVGVGTGPLLTGLLSEWAGGGGAALAHGLVATTVVAALGATLVAALMLRPGGRAAIA